ncbi:WbqC family protein [Colwellia sp. D2M02]|uniref:WbqC family protein n=1 Tax=Colwellia sp. D2M02 TaxID=2841562 RepID=UPI001C09BB19|nr:WbqC family protein [Colwellia sp. D2M02]MBU2891931.1 WbqC family protein [Colwellia sp. D2M02]
MKLAIMQPYFFPYIGYFQLINAVDEFVIYDDIQYTKKGWINRNRILQNGSDSYITLPLKKASDYLNVNERFLSDTWPKERQKLLNKIANSYRKAPYFSAVYPVIEEIVTYESNNLFDYLYNSITLLMEYMNITTKLVVSSTLAIDNNLTSENKVLAICKAMMATEYINPIGGTDLYQHEHFAQNKINLHFLQSEPLSYPQFNSEFIPWLSIIDILMFNSLPAVKELLTSRYQLIQ